MRITRVTPAQRAMVNRARDFAVMAHKGQTRKNSDMPFDTHPYFVWLAVMGRVSVAGEAGAHLHDVKEDTKYTDLSAFPLRVQQIVDVLTRRDDETKPEMIDRIGASGDIEAIIIKIADRFHNLTEGGKGFGKNWLFEYLKGARHILKIADDNGLKDFDLTKLLASRVEELMEGLRNES